MYYVHATDKSGKRDNWSKPRFRFYQSSALLHVTEINSYKLLAT